MLDHVMTDPAQLKQHICCSAKTPHHCEFKMNIEQLKRNGMQLPPSTANRHRAIMSPCRQHIAPSTVTTTK
jgi:hypothetical protein